MANFPGGIILKRSHFQVSDEPALSEAEGISREL
jgi:hypothetical protein